METKCQRAISRQEGVIMTWEIEVLWRYAERLEPFPMPVADLKKPLHKLVREFRQYDVEQHIQRIADADLSYPIIFGDDGDLLDGRHRLCRAAELGLSTIPAVQLPTLPVPTYIEPDDQTWNSFNRHLTVRSFNWLNMAVLRNSLDELEVAEMVRKLDSSNMSLSPMIPIVRDTHIAPEHLDTLREMGICYQNS